MKGSDLDLVDIIVTDDGLPADLAVKAETAAKVDNSNKNEFIS